MENCSSVLVPLDFVQDFEGASLHTVLVYSYMLYMFNECEQHNKLYIETYKDIADNTRMTEVAAYLQVRILRDLMLIMEFGGDNPQGSRYEVADKYNLYK